MNYSNYEITVNGHQKSCKKGTCVKSWLENNAIDPDKVVVELNEEILPKEFFATKNLDGGDRLEIIHFVGGG